MTRKNLAGLAALALGWAAPAQAATDLECVDGGYSTEEMSQIRSFQEGFAVDSFANQEPPPEILGAIITRAGTCSEAHGWSPEAIEQAVIYRLFNLLEQTLTLRSPLTGTQMDRLSAALASADQQRVRRVFGGIADAVLGGQEEPEVGNSDEMFLASILMRSGIPYSESNGEFAGAWLAAKVLTEVVAERFAAL